jgi:hypothetical protein
MSTIVNWFLYKRKSTDEISHCGVGVELSMQNRIFKNATTLSNNYWLPLDVTALTTVSHYLHLLYYFWIMLTHVCNVHSVSTGTDMRDVNMYIFLTLFVAQTYGM